MSIVQVLIFIWKKRTPLYIYRGVFFLIMKDIVEKFGGNTNQVDNNLTTKLGSDTPECNTTLFIQKILEHYFSYTLIGIFSFSIWEIPQSLNWLMNGMSILLLSVKVYSTFGGTS